MRDARLEADNMENKYSKMISVVVPIYNVELFLHQCIDSILEQSYENLEIILVDDGSTDKSGIICDTYTDPRIRVFHTENGGLSAARNIGIDKAHGQYIYFVDSDDWIDHDILEIAIRSIDNADILCFSGKAGVYSGMEACIAHINNQIGSAVWNKLFKRECFSAIRFPEGHVYEDTAVIYKLLFNSKLVICKNVSGYHHRNREGSITHLHDKQNLIDFWLANKGRYDYCINVLQERICDQETIQYNLLRSCAISIVRAWAWRNSNNERKSYEWERMSDFSRNCFPRKIKKKFPFRLRGGLFLARYNHSVSFWIAYYANQLTRKKCPSLYKVPQ